MGRKTSSTSKTIGDCVSQMPRPPQASSQLTSVLFRPGAREPIDLGTVDAETCHALRPEQCVEKASFLNSVPPALALMKRCIDNKVMVAPSEIVANGTGLYTTSDIPAGTVLLRAESISGRWVGIGELQEAGANASNSLKVELVTPYRMPKEMFLVGDASRFPWPHLNSTRGTGREPNLRWDFVPGDMGNEFVVFTTTREIPAFSDEILLDYKIRFENEIAPGTHSNLEGQVAEAAEFCEGDIVDALFNEPGSQDTQPVEDRVRDYAKAGAVMEPDMVTYIAALLRTPHTQRERERDREHSPRTAGNRHREHSAIQTSHTHSI